MMQPINALLIGWLLCWAAGAVPVPVSSRMLLLLIGVRAMTLDEFAFVC